MVTAFILYSGKVATHCASLCLHSPIPVLTSNQQELYDSLMELITMHDTQTRVDKKTNNATKDPQSITFAHQNPFELPQKKSHSKKGGKSEKPLKLVVYLIYMLLSSYSYLSIWDRLSLVPICCYTCMLLISLKELQLQQ